MILRRYTTLGELFEEERRRSDALRNIYAQPDRPFLFVGSGVEYGVHAGWAKFVDDILSRCGMPLKIDRDETQPERAERAKSENEEMYTAAVLHEYSSWEPINQLVMGDISRLDLRGIITTNYGSTLINRFSSQGFQLSRPDSVLGDYISPLSPPSKRVFHIHGHISEGQSLHDELDIVLASSEYKKYYEDSQEIRSFLQMVFARESVIFVGLGLGSEDPFPNILTMLAQAKRTDNTPQTYERQRLYALMSLPVKKDETTYSLDLSEVNQKEDYFAKMGVMPIWFDPSNNYKHLSGFIRKLADSGNKIQGITDNGGEPPLMPSRP